MNGTLKKTSGWIEERGILKTGFMINYYYFNYYYDHQVVSVLINPEIVGSISATSRILKWITSGTGSTQLREDN